jgi:hypothetical protein
LQVPLEQLAEPAVEDSSRVARRTGNDAESQRIFEHFASIAASGSESEAGDVTGQLQPAQRASNLTVTAALILQPELAPEPLRQSDLGAGDLESLLPEAARSRMSRSIVALVTLQHSNGSTVNAMLLRLQVEYLRQSSNSGSGEDAEALILRHPIAVPPTLGQLLGEDADRFLVGELKPPAAAEQN